MISLVMPVWITNQELLDLTIAAYNSFIRSEGWKDVEFIIVDNGSTMGADIILPTADIYIRNQENLGYPAGVNQGVKLASGDLIAVANNDICVSPNWIQVTEGVFKQRPKSASLHFKMVGYHERFNVGNQVWERGKELWLAQSFFVLNKKVVDLLYKKDGYLLDKNYGLGGYDDWDWRHRVNHILKWKSVYTNAAAYQHKDSSTLNTLQKEERSLSDRKNRNYFKKKFGKYPEDIWKEKYPEVMKMAWKPFP